MDSQAHFRQICATDSLPLPLAIKTTTHGYRLQLFSGFPFACVFTFLLLGMPLIGGFNFISKPPHRGLIVTRYTMTLLKKAIISGHGGLDASRTNGSG